MLKALKFAISRSSAEGRYLFTFTFTYSRNFTRRLNTLIEFEIGAARQSAARKNFPNAKCHLACASALIAKPEGFTALLNDLNLDPNYIDFTEDDDVAKEVDEAREAEVVVSNVIRRLHCQLGVSESVAKAPLLGNLNREALLAEAT